MIIFSTVFKILNKLKGNLILYTVILLAITLFNTTSGNMNHYEATKPDILIVNKDQNNEITKGFVSYLKEQAILKDIDYQIQHLNQILKRLKELLNQQGLLNKNLVLKIRQVFLFYLVKQKLFSL